jgi:hypothetical protein|uniref:Glycosyl transferase family 1 domain-containing protein n=1 Tax=viral metagenome TaxID=1070528 RepID=A0A6C0IXG1_9ZZZZ
MTKLIVSYCNNKYPENYGGVARFDYCLSLIFPNRIFFKGPEDINLLLDFCKENNKEDYIIITDNHLSSQIPDEIPLIVVHHGVARTHLEREPNWDIKWKNLCVYGQDLMFHLRSPKNTVFVSPTIFCKNEFGRIYGKMYNTYKNIYITHASELDELVYKTTFNKKPIIVGNWIQDSKGKHLIEELKMLLPEFEFKPLELDFKNKTIEEYNKEKQDYYMSGDIYLCLSLVEGCSYSLLDAMLTNLLIVSTDVGIMENEVNKRTFVDLSWNNLDVNLICNKIKYIWENKKDYFNKSREEYFKITSWDRWKKEWNNVINYSLLVHATNSSGMICPPTDQLI